MSGPVSHRVGAGISSINSWSASFMALRQRNDLRWNAKEAGRLQDALPLDTKGSAAGPSSLERGFEESDHDGAAGQGRKGRSDKDSVAIVRIEAMR
ncbi:hypothetical protein FGB62_258g03 [Gracilaria domingensis]|nr:hypothetical protein FGB62_258g03 [Gracilaria domingensis]